MALLAPFWVLLGARLASFLVLLVALRCLLGFSWPPLRSSWGLIRRRLGAPGGSKTTFKQHSHRKRRYLANHSISTRTRVVLMLVGWAWELNIVPRKVHRVRNDQFEEL